MSDDISLPSTRFAVLAIGTELTTGQITNRNAAWISEQVVALGGEVVSHVTVADDRVAMIQALDWLATQVSGIFVTGGLGPTSDDFTRDVIAQWCGKKLEYQGASWDRINARLGGLGVTVAASNKQQCYFPVGATVYPNDRGTADGFRTERGPVTLWVLPGPPIELAGLWDTFLRDEVRVRLPAGALESLATWGCIGKSEAAVGEIVDAITAPAGLRVGYRAHQPYIEVKVWYPTDRAKALAPVLAAVEQALAPWVVVRTGEELSAMLATLTAAMPRVVFLDGCTDGILQDRLGTMFTQRRQNAQDSIVLNVTGKSAIEDIVTAKKLYAHADVIFTLTSTSNSELGWVTTMDMAGRSLFATLASPYHSATLIKTRGRAIAAELALKQWCTWLST